MARTRQRYQESTMYTEKDDINHLTDNLMRRKEKKLFLYCIYGNIKIIQDGPDNVKHIVPHS